MYNKIPNTSDKKKTDSNSVIFKAIISLKGIHIFKSFAKNKNLLEWNWKNKFYCQKKSEHERQLGLSVPTWSIKFIYVLENKSSREGFFYFYPLKIPSGTKV